MLAVPAWGVPASVAVPLRLSRKVTPAGKAPVSVMAAVGNPVVVMVNEPAWPTVEGGGAGGGDRRGLLDGQGEVLGRAGSNAIGGREGERNRSRRYPLPVRPASVAVPLWLSVRVTPAGSEPVSVMEAVGYPVVVMVNEPDWPTVKLLLSALVIVGRCPVQ